MLLSFEDEGLAVVRQNMSALGTVTTVIGSLRHHGIASSRFAADACQLLSLLVADEDMRQEALALELGTFVDTLLARHSDDSRLHRLADELQAGLRGVWHVRSAAVRIPRPPLSINELRKYHPFVFGRHHLDEDPDGPRRRKYGEPVTVKTTKGGPEIDTFEDMVRQQENGTAPPMVPYLHLDVPDDRPFYESCDHRPTDPDLVPVERIDADHEEPVLGLSQESAAQARTRRAKILARNTRAAIESRRFIRPLPPAGAEEDEDEDEDEEEPSSPPRRFDVQLLYYLLKYHKDRPDSLYVVFVVFTLALGAGPLPDARLTQGKASRYGDRAASGSLQQVVAEEGSEGDSAPLQLAAKASVVHDHVRLDDFEVQELPQLVHYLLRPLRHFPSHPALPHYVCKSIAALARSAPLSTELGRQGAVTALLTIAQGIEASVGRDTQQEALWALSELVRSPSNAGMLRQASGSIVLRELAGRANAERMDRALFVTRLQRLQRRVLQPLVDATQATARAVRAEHLRTGDAQIGRGPALSASQMASITGNDGTWSAPLSTVVSPAQAAYHAAETASLVAKAAGRALQTGPDRRASVIPSTHPQKLSITASESVDTEQARPESAGRLHATAVTPQEANSGFLEGRYSDDDRAGSNISPPVDVSVAESPRDASPDAVALRRGEQPFPVEEAAGALSPSVAARFSGRQEEDLGSPLTEKTGQARPHRSLNRVPGLATRMALHDRAQRSVHKRRSARTGTPRSLATPRGSRRQSTAREVLLSAREGADASAYKSEDEDEDAAVMQGGEHVVGGEQHKQETKNPILEAVHEDWNAAVRELGGDPLETAAAATFVDQSTATFAPVVPKPTTVGWHAEVTPPLGVPPAPGLVLPQELWKLLDRWEKEAQEE